MCNDGYLGWANAEMGNYFWWDESTLHYSYWFYLKSIDIDLVLNHNFYKNGNVSLLKFLIPMLPILLLAIQNIISYKILHKLSYCIFNTPLLLDAIKYLKSNLPTHVVSINHHNIYNPYVTGQ